VALEGWWHRRKELGEETAKLAYLQKEKGKNELGYSQK